MSSNSSKPGADVLSVSDDLSSPDEECWDSMDNKCYDVVESCKSDDEIPDTDLKGRLQAWAVDCKVTHNQLDKLLPILKEVDKSSSLFQDTTKNGQ